VTDIRISRPALLPCIMTAGLLHCNIVAGLLHCSIPTALLHCIISTLLLHCTIIHLVGFTAYPGPNLNIGLTQNRRGVKIHLLNCA